MWSFGTLKSLKNSKNTNHAVYKFKLHAYVNYFILYITITFNIIHNFQVPKFCAIKFNAKNNVTHVAVAVDSTPTPICNCLDNATGETILEWLIWVRLPDDYRTFCGLPFWWIRINDLLKLKYLRYTMSLTHIKKLQRGSD